MACRGECIHDIAADLVAAAADGWADRHHEVGRPASELTCQRIDGGNRRTGRRSPPTGMNRGYGTAASIRDEQRDAIRRAYGNGNVRDIRDAHVRFRTPLWNGAALLDDCDVVSVLLGERDDFPRTNGIAEASEISGRRQLQLSRREGVRRTGLERPTSQHGSP